ncbi:hypothetical protein [Selenomonas ruminis]|uniref:Uncharacterized protein n=1 Tax=Selenomonas ruminis TaxID=2593411 RepID=A0A5D6VY93_9FIRM|nr:hypothetical protein FZ040_11695 [Selenomonas sp. mPRGC5]
MKHKLKANLIFGIIAQTLHDYIGGTKGCKFLVLYPGQSLSIAFGEIKDSLGHGQVTGAGKMLIHIGFTFLLVIFPCELFPLIALGGRDIKNFLNVFLILAACDDGDRLGIICHLPPQLFPDGLGSHCTAGTRRGVEKKIDLLSKTVLVVLAHGRQEVDIALLVRLHV